MSSVGIKDAAGDTRAIDTFVRTEGAGQVETQAVAIVNPSTGDPLLPTAGGAMPVAGTFWQATQPVSVAALPLPAGAATDAGLAAVVGALGTPLQAGGAVAVSNFPATQPVSGTFWQATQPVSFTWAGLTDAQLRATAVPVSGTFWQATQPVSAAALPLPAGAATETTLASLDAKLPALDAGRLPVSLPPGGGGLTDTELRAAAVPVDVAGELLEAIEALRMGLQALTRTVGLLMPDSAGRMRVNLETGTTAVTGTLTGVTTVTTVATLTNQAQVGALAANDQIPALLRVAAAGLRNNILVS